MRATETRILAAALLAGCSGQPAIGVPQATQTAVARSSTALSAKGLIYAFGSFKAGDAAILAYPNGKLVATFSTGIGFGSACSDSRGNVFVGGEAVSAAPVIAKYAYGATSPSKTVLFGSNGGVVSCTVNGATGNVAAAVEYGASDYSIAVLPHFADRPKIYQDSSIPIVLSAGYDGSGNLFILGTDSSYRRYSLAELPKGGTSFRAISLKLGSGRARTVAWDGAELTIEGLHHGPYKDSWAQIVYVLHIWGTKAKVVKKIPFDGLDRSNEPSPSTIVPALGIMAVPTGEIHLWNYPSGGKMIAKLHTGVGPTYTATLAVRSPQ